MKRSNPRCSAMTRLELIVVLGVLFVLATLVDWGVPTHALLKGQLTQSANNSRQVQIAASQMAHDGLQGSEGVKPGDPDLAWPGDLAQRLNDPVTTVSGYLQIMIDRGYLKRSDVIKIFTAPGITPWNGVGKLDGSTNVAFKIYRVTSKDTNPSTIFSATRNFTYGSPLNPDQAPYGKKGFVVVETGGSALALQASQVTNLKIIGMLPGRKDLGDRPVEGLADTLVQK